MWRTIFGIKTIEQKEQNETQKHNELDTNDWNGKGEAKWKVWAATEKKRMPTTAMISATKPEKNSQIPAKKTATTNNQIQKKERMNEMKRGSTQCSAPII